MKIINRIKVFLAAVIWLGIQSHDVFSQQPSSSLLSAGKWFKMALKQEGIYRIDYSKLKQMGLPNLLNPRIYGNNQGQLSYYNDNTASDDLKEIPVMLVKGSDGIFNEGDYLLFYAKGPDNWKYDKAGGTYNFLEHNYSDSAYYFITSSPSQGTILQPAGVITDPVTFHSSSYDALFIHDIDAENLIKSGREWYEPISTIQPVSIATGFSSVLTNEKVKYEMRVIGRSSSPTVFTLSEGTRTLLSVDVPEVNVLSTTGLYAYDIAAGDSSLPASSAPSYSVSFSNNGETGAKGWIDYVKIQARASLIFNGNNLVFSDSRSTAAGAITEFSISSQSSGINVWDITDQYNPKIMTLSASGNNYSFTFHSDSLRRFIAFTTDKAMNPVFRNEQLVNQDLHGSADADMIIVTHPLFIKQAEKLKDLHYAESGLISLMVTPEQIYNEFSGGLPDIAAIRNFMRMKFMKQQSSSHPLKYLLLFGDGSYENRTLPPKNPNFIPTYQSQNSLLIVSSFTSDDFYGLLEDGEGEASGTEDIGIGRFPVSDTSQASIMVSKVEHYMSSKSIGNWRNMVTIVADDEDGNTHMTDAEGLYQLLNDSYPQYNVDKIYLDAFKQVTSVNGQSYPDVTKAINDRINSGTLIFDYLGHGNEIGLAHERVVKTENINSWRNGAKLPLFITATCEFSRFDDIEINPINNDMTGKTSAGEMVILNPDGGGIALMTTTRVVYSAPNYTLNRNIIDYAFSRNKDSSAYRLGDIIRLAKIRSGESMNKRNFLLLGDPAVRLEYPWHGTVITDSVNSVPVAQPVDTMKALSEITVSGHIKDLNGNIMQDFNGIVNPVVFDKVRKVKTLSNDGGQVMEFDLRNNILFSGKTVAKDGKFSFTFIVPKDIDYTFGPGKISYYASKGDTDATGSYSSAVVGGFSKSPATDTQGPSIRLFLNDTLFRQGGICDSDPVLIAIIEDEGGINTTGTGIGHDITAWLDDERNGSAVLNNYFETNIDNYRKGGISYPLASLQGGDHTITLKAWDNYNNSSQQELKFVVKGSDGFIITNLLNFPNPFTDNTSITAEHNRPDRDLNITISIFDMSGRTIKIIKTESPSTGYRLQPILWDGSTDGGRRVGRGIYPYTVTITTPEGETARASGRMIIL